MSEDFSPEFYQAIEMPLNPIEAMRPMLNDNERLRSMLEVTVTQLGKVVKARMKQSSEVLGFVEKNGALRAYGITKKGGLGFFLEGPGFKEGTVHRWPYHQYGFAIHIQPEKGEHLVPEQFENDLKAFLVGETGQKSCFANEMFGRYHI